MKIVILLLELEVDIFIVDSEGRNALFISLLKGNLNCFNILIEYIENKYSPSVEKISFLLNQKDKTNNSSFFISTKYPTLWPDILKYSPDLEARFNGKTIFHWSCMYSNIVAAQSLLEKVDICVTDDNRKTCIFIAAEEGNVEMVKYLISQVDKITEKVSLYNQIDIEGNTASHIAAYFEFSDILDLLVSKEDWDILNNDKKSVRMILMNEEDNEVREIRVEVPILPSGVNIPIIPNIDIKLKGIEEGDMLGYIQNVIYNNNNLKMRVISIYNITKDTFNSIEECFKQYNFLLYPGLLQIYGVYLPKSGQPGLIYENYRGSLKQLLETGNRDVELYSRIFLNIAYTISYLHDLEVVHGSITSEHIMLTELLAPKLIDLGWGSVYESITKSKYNSGYKYNQEEAKREKYDDIYGLGKTMSEIGLAEFEAISTECLNVYLLIKHRKISILM